MRGLGWILVALSVACGEPAPRIDAAPPAPDAAPGAPVILQVAWTHAGGCTPGVRSDVYVQVSVRDPDHAEAELDIEGHVEGCASLLESTRNVISCPQAAPYDGSVRVTDPDGNAAALEFQILPCKAGSARP